MKKFLSISLVVAMVLALGSLAMASELGGITTGTIDVEATIGEYAIVTVTEDVEFGDLSGATGTFTADGCFMVETNAEVDVNVEFIPDNWLKSKTWFNILDEIIGSESTEHLQFTTFQQNHKDGKKDYPIVGNLLIASISEQASGTYTADIKVTVSK